MTALPDNLTETPHTYAGGGPRLDVLDEILSSLRLTGGVVVDGEFSGDYCLGAQFTPVHFQPWFDVPETLIPPSFADFNTYMERSIESSAIAVGPAARTIARDIIYPTPWILKPGTPVHRLATAGLLPEKLRRAYGLQWSARRERLFLLMAGIIRGLLPLIPELLRIVPNARRSERRLRRRSEAS